MAEPRPDMNIKVAAFTVSEKSINRNIVLNCVSSLHIRFASIEGFNRTAPSLLAFTISTKISLEHARLHFGCTFASYVNIYIFKTSS